MPLWPGVRQGKTGVWATGARPQKGASSSQSQPPLSPPPPAAPSGSMELGDRPQPLCQQLGQASQVETVSEENKSLMWVLLKQLRPGMDLSRVVLPTFILEPRSFLDKLSDYYYHADLLSR